MTLQKSALCTGTSHRIIGFWPLIYYGFFYVAFLLLDSVVGPFHDFSVGLDQSGVVDGLTERPIGSDKGKSFSSWHQLLLERGPAFCLFPVDSLQWLLGKLFHQLFVSNSAVDHHPKDLFSAAMGCHTLVVIVRALETNLP